MTSAAAERQIKPTAFVEELKYYTCVSAVPTEI